MPATPIGSAATDADRLAHEPATLCLNCGAVLPGRFCPDCGQLAEPARLPLHRVVRDSFTEVFGLDGRFWRSAARLMGSPGFLTKAYLRGQRVRYLRPLRLYLTATLTFFFLLSVFDPAARIGRQMDDLERDTLTTVADALASVDSVLARPRADGDRAADSLNARVAALGAAIERTSGGAGRLSTDSAAALRRAQNEAYVALGERRDEGVDIRPQGQRDARRRLVVEHAILEALPRDSLIDASRPERAALVVFPDTLNISGLPAWMGSSSLRDLKQATTRSERIQAFAALSRAAIGRLPTVMFVLLPLFALLLKLLYVRRDWLYTEHLIFTLHTHAFTFFVFALLVGLIVAGDGAAWTRSTAFSLSTVAIPLYFLVAQKRVYEQSWAKTFVKAVVLGVMYTLVLALGLTGAIVLAAALG